jgi:hypothetical protein
MSAPNPPTIDPPSGQHDRTLFTVTISVPNPPDGVTMRWTQDETIPDINHGNPVDGPTVSFQIVVPRTIMAIAILGNEVSGVSEAVYTVIPPTRRPPPVPPPRPGQPPPPPVQNPPPPPPPPPPPTQLPIGSDSIDFFQVFYRPDNHPDWILWKEIPRERFKVIGRPGAIDTGGLPVARPGFSPRVPLGKPADVCDATTGRNLKRGYEFQIRIAGVGHVVIDRFRLHAQKLVEKSRAHCQ